MTGFGVGGTAVGNGTIVVETRTVNHRYLDIRYRLPDELADQGVSIEHVIRQHFSRGRFDLSAYVEGTPFAGIQVNTIRAKAAFDSLTPLCRELAPNQEVPLLLLTTVPQLFTVSETDKTAVRTALQSSLEKSLHQLNEMRIREGNSLYRDISKRLDTLRAIVRVIQQKLPTLMPILRNRVRERTAHLFAEKKLQIDESRFEQEVIFFADRSDFSEEITRLEIHLDGMGELLKNETQPIGRKLDFFLQEIMREMNTTGSKCQDAYLSRQIIEAKAEIDRLREQVQNVE